MPIDTMIQYLDLEEYEYGVILPVARAPLLRRQVEDPVPVSAGGFLMKCWHRLR